jgi:hypothetical protein
MARELTLKPTFLSDRLNPWMLRVPAYLSDIGNFSGFFTELSANHPDPI